MSRAANPALRRLWRLLPTLFWLVAFCLLPLCLIVAYSLGTRTEGGGVALGFSLENYLRFFNSGFYLLVTARSRAPFIPPSSFSTKLVDAYARCLPTLGKA